MTGKRRILVADDDDGIRRIVGRHLEDAGYLVNLVSSGDEARDRLHTGDRFEALVTDIQMPGIGGIALLAEAKRLDPTLPVVVITAHGSIETAVEAMRLGAYDYLEKPFHRDVLLLTVERALRHRGLLEENLRLAEVLAREFSIGNLVGGSPAMQEVFRIAGRAAPTEAPILILGESGTGKELLAKALHFNSDRAKKPFITVNVAAIPESLVEAELFGVVKGAFTGAVANRTGLFRQANGGTLFLDEIGEMRIDLQSKLLRTLESGDLRPVGSEREEHADVRIIAATNRDLATAVEEYAFRRDLYHRIAVVVLRLPPLRERIEDLPLLVNHLLGRQGAAGIEVAPEAMRKLAAWHWPGNVRELENELRRAVLGRERTDAIGVGDLSPEIRAGRPVRTGTPAALDLQALELPDEGINLADLEKRVIARALEKTGGNQTKAASLLGITRQTLIYRMEKYGLKHPV